MRPRDNPFRAQRVDLLAFEPQGTNWEALLARLQALQFRAAVVGPHGSGKTTFLEGLADRLAGMGRRPRRLFRNRGGGRAIPEAWLPLVESPCAGDVWLVDGYEQLGFRERTQLCGAAAGRVGLVATAHRRTRLPTLLHTKTSPALLSHLVERLGATLPAEQVIPLFQRHRGNLRDALRELYDREADRFIFVQRPPRMTGGVPG